MGVFDYFVVPNNPHLAQLKCWNPEFKTYRIGDRVPALIKDNHSIQMREKDYGWINLVYDAMYDNAVIFNVTPLPKTRYLFDKFGETIEDWMLPPVKPVEQKEKFDF